MHMHTYMNEALRLAEDAAQAGEVPVGCVIVKDGTVIARSSNSCERDRDPMMHAEMKAMKEALAVLGTKDLRGCTLCVTLEPCPMCAGAIVHSGISVLVFGSYDTEFGAFGSAYNLASHPYASGLEVYGGIMESQCSALLRGFFKDIRESTKGEMK